MNEAITKAVDDFQAGVDIGARRQREQILRVLKAERSDVATAIENLPEEVDEEADDIHQPLYLEGWHDAIDYLLHELKGNK
jgi:hypothetical protein